MKTLKTVSVSMMVLLVATFGLMAADSVDESAQFTIGDSYNIRVINSTSLGFGESSSVGNVSEDGSFTSSELEVKLDHNYDVSITGTGSAFDLDTSTSDYSDPYAVEATWDVEYKVADGSYSSLGNKVVSSPGTSKEVSYNANVDTTEGDVWTKISVTADRNGLDDPSGTYKAEMDISVSNLNN